MSILVLSWNKYFILVYWYSNPHSNSLNLRFSEMQYIQSSSRWRKYLILTVIKQIWNVPRSNFLWFQNTQEIYQFLSILIYKGESILLCLRTEYPEGWKSEESNFDNRRFKRFCYIPHIAFGLGLIPTAPSSLGLPSAISPGA